MKNHKKLLIYSSILTSIAILCYFVFSCEKIQCKYITDLSLALFGSGVFLILTSCVGYKVEKQQSIYNITRIFCDLGITDRFTLSEDGEYQYTCTRELLRNILQVELDKTSAFIIELEYYTQGCFITPKDLEATINNDVKQFLSNMFYLSEYVAHKDCKENVLRKRTELLIEEEHNVKSKLHDLLGFRNDEMFSLKGNWISEFEDI